jgi:hypothetical protein
MAHEPGTRLTVQERRKFALSVGAALLLLGGLLVWRGHSAVGGTSGVLGLILGLAGLAIPTRLGPVQRAWMRLAHLISKVTTPVVMGFMYYLVIAPTGLLTRILGHRPIHRPPDASSYWVRREAPRSDLERQF